MKKVYELDKRTQQYNVSMCLYKIYLILIKYLTLADDDVFIMHCNYIKNDPTPAKPFPNTVKKFF